MTDQDPIHRGTQGDINLAKGINIENITPQAIERLCQTQLDRKIQAGFHRVLGKSAIDYSSDFETAVRKAMAREQQYTNTGMLVLVEPRIPITEQSKMLDINIGRTVFDLPPHEPMWAPYSVWLDVVDNPSGLTQLELIESLPDHLRPSTLFEGVNADLSGILTDRKSVIMPVLQKAGTHCLQTSSNNTLELGYISGFYGPEDVDSTDNNLYQRRKLYGVGMLVSYVDRV